MRMKTITALAALAFAFTAGAASAAEPFPALDADQNASSVRFTVLEGVPAEAMTTPELRSVAGTAGLLIFLNPAQTQSLIWVGLFGHDGDIVLTLPKQDIFDQLVANRARFPF